MSLFVQQNTKTGQFLVESESYGHTGRRHAIEWTDDLDRATIYGFPNLWGRTREALAGVEVCPRLVRRFVMLLPQ